MKTHVFTVCIGLSSHIVWEGQDRQDNHCTIHPTWEGQDSPIHPAWKRQTAKCSGTWVYVHWNVLSVPKRKDRTGRTEPSAVAYVCMSTGLSHPSHMGRTGQDRQDSQVRGICVNDNGTVPYIPHGKNRTGRTAKWYM